MSDTTFRLPDVSCDHFVRAITQELTTLPGVARVEVDLATKQVRVQQDSSVSNAQLREGINVAGYDIAA